MRDFFEALARRKIALAGSGVLLVIFFLAIFAPVVATYDPMGLNPVDRLQNPSAKHWFGTDHFGRDICSRIVYGARMTMISGSGVVVYSILFGILIGLLSGYFQEFGLVAMRLVDVVMSFPLLLLAPGADRHLGARPLECDSRR